MASGGKEEHGQKTKRRHSDASEETESNKQKADPQQSVGIEESDKSMPPKTTAEILRRLRDLMKSPKKELLPSDSTASGELQAIIVPSGDAHLSEYIAACDERRNFVSGFTGSSGTAIVTLDKACLWTDGRYFLQAETQLDDSWTLMRDGLPETPTQAEWLSKQDWKSIGSPTQEKQSPAVLVGADPYLMSAASWKELKTKLASGGRVPMNLVQLATNPVDMVWSDRPDRPHQCIRIHDRKYAGESWQNKVRQVRAKMEEKDVSVMVVSALDQVAWLLNLRGSDIQYNPVFFSYVVLTMDKLCLFIDPQHELPSEEVKQHLQIFPYDAITEELALIIRGQHTRPNENSMECEQETVGKIWVCEKSTSEAIMGVVKQTCKSDEKKIVTDTSPIAAMKAVKNSAEIKAMERAHVKDGVALCQYLVWLEQEIHSGKVTEISGADKLEEFRRQQKGFISLSFDTISSTGDHGAIIHYKPTPESDKVLSPDELYLCDSGAQYSNGTTDVTRTVHFGTPTTEEKRFFTLVLKGHIRLAAAVFPNGVKGSRLDTLARLPLWEVGLDYLHGTGHGVGAALNVHEGPCGISYRSTPAEIALKEGMILSNEPGYYEDGKFGIRIENLVVVTKCDTEYNFKDKGFLNFKTITMVPIQQKLIVKEMLTKEEVEWLNEYHLQCRLTTGEALKVQGHKETYKWLLKETEPIHIFPKLK